MREKMCLLTLVIPSATVRDKVLNNGIYSKSIIALNAHYAPQVQREFEILYCILFQSQLRAAGGNARPICNTAAQAGRDMWLHWYGSRNKFTGDIKMPVVKTTNKGTCWPDDVFRRSHKNRECNGQCCHMQKTQKERSKLLLTSFQSNTKMAAITRETTVEAISGGSEETSRHTPDHQEVTNQMIITPYYVDTADDFILPTSRRPWILHMLQLRDSRTRCQEMSEGQITTKYPRSRP